MREDPRFGTDGVRGVANADLSAYFTFRLGRVAGALLTPRGAAPRMLVGRDTRASGDLLFSALAAGLTSVGVDVVDMGIIPTAGVALLTRTSGAAAGAMLSASHNPAPDNGIKFFGPDGRKIADTAETAIQQRIDDWEGCPSPTGAGVGRIRPGALLVDEYADYLERSAPCPLQGLRVVMDCGHGAASQLGPRIAAALGAEVIALSHDPDGMNINAGCGALHPQAAQDAVRKHGAHLGVSFDGDADRAILADETGALVDGDRVLALCALAWRNTPRLPGNTVVGTVMSNLGLETGLAEHGVRLIRAAVGDRHVADTMLESGSSLGGEKSGHVIFSQLATTGDGMLTLIQVAALMLESGLPLSALAGRIREYPQVLVNVPVWRRRGWRDQADLWAAVRAAEAQLGARGRILVRASGTERLIRVMAEGPEEAEIQALVDGIATVIHAQMGPPAGSKGN